MTYKKNFIKFVILTSAISGYNLSASFAPPGPGMFEDLPDTVAHNPKKPGFYAAINFVLNQENPFAPAAVLDIVEFDSAEKAKEYATNEGFKSIDCQSIIENHSESHEAVTTLISNKLKTEGHTDLPHLSRLKAPVSLKTKIVLRKDALDPAKERKPVKDVLNDISANRVITKTEKEALAIIKLLQTELRAQNYLKGEKGEIRSRDKHCFALSYTLNNTSFLGTKFLGSVGELQVWPLAKVAWLDWHHDASYKGNNISKVQSKVVNLFSSIVASKLFHDYFLANKDTVEGRGVERALAIYDIYVTTVLGEAAYTGLNSYEHLKDIEPVDTEGNPTKRFTASAIKKILVNLIGTVHELDFKKFFPATFL